MSEAVLNNAKVYKFPAPEGDYRQVVLDYMFKMANVEWTPSEDMQVGWRNKGDFGVNLLYKKGVKYHGIPYSNTKSNLDAFEQFLDKDGVFSFDSYYFEDIIGNHCSSSMGMAFQMLIDMPHYGALKPCEWQANMIMPTIEEIKIPKEFGDSYDSYDVWNANPKEVIFEGFAALQPADILYFNKKTGSGHTRMIRAASDVVRFENGLIDPDNSYANVIEQTNAWEKEPTDRNTTWWIKKRYTFSLLYEKFFMPMTLRIYHTGEKAKDAYIMYEGNNTAESIKNGLNGKIISTFPLNYVLATVRDESGKIVKKAHSYDFQGTYNVDLAEISKDFTLADLKPGKYTYDLRAGITRGAANPEHFEFTV